MLLAALFFSYSYSNAQTTAEGVKMDSPEVRLTSPGANTIYDDGYAEVPLQFIFPFYGENFNTSWMYSNGVVGFKDPNSGVESSWCCTGMDLQAMADQGIDISRYSFAIAPLWVDLVDLQLDTNGDGVVDSGFFTQGDIAQQTYIWRNIAEFADATKLNTFQLTIRPDGTYQVDYANVDIANHSVTAGASGDLSNMTTGFDNGFQQYYYSTGISGILGDWGNGVDALCSANPLYDPKCSGYAAAYAEYLFQQQCSANPLYDSGCVGYASAYFTQQCSINPLYNMSCSGYADAYFIQQCTLDSLYDTQCSGYNAAYLIQQCSLDSLYDTQCSGYDVAYLDQQCSYSALYDSSCTGYSTAYFNQQCELDGQSDNTCPNYISMSIVNDGSTFDPVQNAIETPSFTSNFGGGGIQIEGVSVPEVPFEVARPVETQPMVQEQVEVAQSEMSSMENSLESEVKEMEKLEETKKEEVVAEESSSNTDKENSNEKETTTTESKKDSKNKEKGSEQKTDATTKEQKIRLLIAKKADDLAKQVENAVTIEQQMLVQGQLMALISFVPNFDYASKPISDLENYYPAKNTVDHQFSRWFLNDPKFLEMEDLQYNFN